MRRNPELMLTSHFITKGNQGIVLEFQKAIAFCAVEVIVLRIAVVMFIDRPSIERKLAK